MATALKHPRTSPGTGGIEDPFHDPVILGIGVVFVAVALIILLLTGLIHWGVEYQTPPWNANSFPPPVAH